MNAIGEPALANDARFANNAGRVQHEAEIDAAIGRWTRAHSLQVVLDALNAASVPCGPIYDVADMMRDEHYQARGMFEEVTIDGAPLKVPAILPKLQQHPGRTLSAGPEIGEHTDEVLCGLLGVSASMMSELRAARVVAG
jgi:crotonobetainyl-CoA:carnitine CoA-transferase CaiB-like acyl-CoA transferase